MLARSQERLAHIESATPNAHASFDVADDVALAATLSQVQESFGAPAIVVHNAVGAERGTYAEIDPQNMRRAFEINTMALLSLAKQLIPDMQASGGGALICTGNTLLIGQAAFCRIRPHQGRTANTAGEHRPRGRPQGDSRGLRRD